MNARKKARLIKVAKKRSQQSRSQINRHGAPRGVVR